MFTQIPLDKHYEGDAEYFYLRGGNGAGKSLCGAIFADSRTKLDPEARGMISAGTYGQLATSTLVALADACFTFGIDLKIGSDKEDPYESREMTARKIASDRFCFINGAYVYVLAATIFKGGTAKSTQAGRGLQIRWLWFDEPAYAQQDAFQAMQTRLGRGTGSMNPLTLLTGTINKDNPRNWCYNLFDDPDRNKETKSLFVSIKCPTSENRVSLSKNFEHSLRSSFTKELAAIELDAEYAQSSSNLVFSYFDRDCYTDSGFEIDSKYPLHISVDFNHHPSCAIAGQFIPGSSEVVVIREWYLEHSDTFKLGKAIAEWVKSVLGNYPRAARSSREDPFLVKVHGDASGNQKTANSKNTNWEIIKKALDRESIYYSTCYGKANPAIQDTVNSINCGFSSQKIWLNSSCKELIKDLEMLQWDSSGGIDKKDIARSHLADCLRYLCWDLLPYRKLVSDIKKSKSNQQQTRPTGVI